MNTFGGSNCLGVWCLLPFLFFLAPRPGGGGGGGGGGFGFIWLKISFFSTKFVFFLVLFKLEQYPNFWLEGMFFSTTFCFLVGILVFVGYFFG